MRVEEERYGSGILLGIDLGYTINNADSLGDEDATVVYQGDDVRYLIEEAASAGDMYAEVAMNKLTKFAELHPEFLFVKGKSLDEALTETEKKATLWNGLSRIQQHDLMLGFAAFKPE